MTAIYVPLPTDVKDALHALSADEGRHPKMQAARLIREGLVRAGALVTAGPATGVLACGNYGAHGLEAGCPTCGFGPPTEAAP